MIVVARPKEFFPRHEGRRRLRGRMWGISFLLIYTGVVVVTGAVLQKNDFFAESVMPYLRHAWELPKNMASAMSARPKCIDIDMKWEAHQQLAYQRQCALEQPTVLADAADFVNAVFTVDGRRVPVKMRLKGDNVDHLRGEKWSFRVRTRGAETIFGMNQFSLQHPRVRNWMFEWLGHRAMRREDVLSLRYDFVDVTLNGKHLGVYALEEHFEKRLVESNQRREGPILRFGEEWMWREINEQIRPFRAARANDAGDFLVSEPDGFQTAATLADDESRGPYLAAVHLLDAFRRGDMATEQAFDARALAVYFALIDLFGAEHGARWHNIRFYYNPVTARLEPIAFDLHGGKPTQSLSLLGRPTITHNEESVTRFERFQRSLFSDLSFCARYLRELDRVSRPEYLDQLLSEIRDDLSAALAVLHADYSYYSFSADQLYANQRYIQSVLRPVKGLHAHLIEADANELRLQLASIQYLPLEVLGVDVDGVGFAEPIDPIVIPPRTPETTLEYRPYSFRLPSNSSDLKLAQSSMFVVYRVLGCAETRRAAVAPYEHDIEKFLRDDVMRAPPTIAKFPFLRVDEPERIIRIRPGHWTINEDLIVPPGYTFAASPATQLDLVNDAMLLSFSPLYFVGTDEEPIVVRSSNGTGRGVAILNADGISELRFVRFIGLTNPSRGNWSLLGAVNFYQSPVVFSDCVFTLNQCEDSLNVIRTRFTIERCTFAKTKFDALDSDFCTGTITDSSFLDPGNDGVDLSGSVVEASNLLVEGAGDKGISTGEASRASFRGLTVRRSKSAVVSKDASELIVSDATISDCQYGLAAFQKKSEFGPGILRANRMTLQDVARPHVVEEGSVIIVDGVNIPANDRHVRDYYYAESGAADRAIP